MKIKLAAHFPKLTEKTYDYVQECQNINLNEINIRKETTS